MEEERRQPLQLTTDLTSQQLAEYFKDKKPEDLDDDTLECLSCLGYAKLLVREFGGANKARIYWLEDGPDEDGMAHAWVVKIGSDPKSKPYNNYLGIDTMSIEEATVEQLEREGLDITDEVLNYEWTAL